jgi:hypothetical protein
MAWKNGAEESAQARMDARKPENPALSTEPEKPLIGFYGDPLIERVDETCLLLMQRGAALKRQLQGQIEAIDLLVNSVVAERARLHQGDAVDEQGNIVRAKKAETVPAA